MQMCTILNKQFLVLFNTKKKKKLVQSCDVKRKNKERFILQKRRMTVNLFSQLLSQQLKASQWCLRLCKVTLVVIFIIWGHGLVIGIEYSSGFGLWNYWQNKTISLEEVSEAEIISNQTTTKSLYDSFFRGIGNIKLSNEFVEDWCAFPSRKSYEMERRFADLEDKDPKNKNMKKCHYGSFSNNVTFEHNESTGQHFVI
ncbi:hypothetical protein RFI_21284, partial [Reticulomyxa filosa]